MIKAKVRILFEVEYDLDPSAFPAGSSPENILATVISGTKVDPYLTLDSMPAKWTVTGELVDAPSPVDSKP